MSELVQGNLKHTIATMLGYSVRLDGVLWKTYLNEELISDGIMAGWTLEESAWKMDVPDWQNDLNAAFKLFPAGTDIHFVSAYHFKQDGLYKVAIDGVGYYLWDEGFYTFGQLALGLCEAFIAWKEYNTATLVTPPSNPDESEVE